VRETVIWPTSMVVLWAGRAYPRMASILCYFSCLLNNNERMMSHSHSHIYLTNDQTAFHAPFFGDTSVFSCIIVGIGEIIDLPQPLSLNLHCR
jgi:hypothetical protein